METHKLAEKRRYALTVRPSDHVTGPQVFRSQPIFEGPEVFSEGGRVQSVLADGLPKRLLPRQRGAPLHDFSANNNRANIALFHGMERGKMDSREKRNIAAETKARCCSTEIIARRFLEGLSIATNGAEKKKET